MSILIRGMKMPRSCADCPLTWVDDEYDKRCCITDKVVLGTIGRQDNANCTDCDCPLVEVPTPHGRLIEADALNKKMDERMDRLKDNRSIYEASCVATALDLFAPTIIEAEGSERQ